MHPHRKTILVIHPCTKDPAEIRRLLAGMGHTAVTVSQQRAALSLLRTVRFDVIFTGLPGSEEGAARQFIGQLRTAAPGSAVVGMNEGGAGANSAPWHAACDATIAEPLSPARVQWVLDFDLRYFGS
jgi:CheY-like chemotaxis protein